ncbi:peptidoglycan-binding protein [Bacillus sp. dmp10]|uniref:peptidoglycan-binding protein n=1 Tax=Bacillus sp. dmp10 TaxID=2293321 RepID=UPI001CB8F887
MPNVKRITDLSIYTSVLPYDSELFGVYHSLIGWKSTRKINRVKSETGSEKDKIISQLGLYFENKSPISFNSDCTVLSPNLEPAGFVSPNLINQDSIVLQQINEKVKTFGRVPVDINEWRQILNNDDLTQILKNNVLAYYNQISIEGCRGSEGEQAQEKVRKGINNEAVIAGVIKQLIDKGSLSVLNDIFFSKLNINSSDAFTRAIDGLNIDFSDPYLTFDPKKDVKDVTLSPLGIVHLFRQYFFELDTFLGTPTGHVWLSPGSTVELIEVSTRKTTIEKTIETSTETTEKSEKSTTDQDELSEAVKQENKEDLKLGFTATANQSWGTGSATATASLNKDSTQQLARETNHKRMRQQSEKLSSEIRENFKSTFKTVTEVTNTSSKRYLLNNNTEKLINYELRRKMRQVAVQVQDIGSYLCWETFVDDPGEDLGLANLVHIAKPADLLPVPDATAIPYPPPQSITCNAKVIWNFGDHRQPGDFIALTPVVDPPQAPEGYQVNIQEGILPAKQLSASGTDFSGIWSFGARFTKDGKIEVGVINTGGDWKWDKFVNFEVGIVLTYVATDAKKQEINAANTKKIQDKDVANAENDRRIKEAYINAVKERVEIASGITKRNFEELRDEERIIVYRRLISSLMTENQYYNTDNSSRHVLSELINSIFDIDKMLYFVAPEYWKPRWDSKLKLFDLQKPLNDDLVTWSDYDPRLDNYLITEKSVPAPMGSSLGWLLQLDGDNQRNAFLNAPWVKAVIPIRPGKEQAAMNWLQNVNVEGTEGLDAEYAAPSDELDKIRAGLGLVPGAIVTIKDAIEYLCIEVAEKNEESNKVKIKTYPETEINDNKVSSTPVDKVYEHGFYPLQGGFRVNPNGPNPDPNNKDINFQVFDQWIEVLPTDQVVPIEVSYDPITGRQV